MSLASKLRDKIKENINVSQQQGIIIIVVIFVIVLLIYFYNKIAQKENNCKNLKKIYEDEISGGYGHIKFSEIVDDPSYNTFTDSNGNTHDLQLRDVYIKTAYNACCSGNFKTDYVDLCALRLPAFYGVRALDFQIYSLKNEPIVAASTTTSHNYKETINHLNFVDVMYEVKKLFVAHNEYKMGDDPLFLIFRLHTTNVDVYNRMASVLGEVYDVDNLSRKQLNIDYDNYEYDFINNTKLSSLKKKIIIIVIHDENSNNEIEKSDLGKYVDTYGSSMQLHRYSELKDNQTQTTLKRVSTKKLSYCMPNLENSNDNFDFLLPLSLGFQFVGMNFQNKDTYLDEYNDFFMNSYGTNNKSHIGFIKKPDMLLEV
tara:strand:- start:144 stop:1256 length:1113 start_codon:yes stop_codon:yes gene_type:complete